MFRSLFIGAFVCTLCMVFLLGIGLKESIVEEAKASDRAALAHVLVDIDYDNDPIADSFLLSNQNASGQWVSIELLGLQRERLAYAAMEAGDVVSVVVPVTADTGFNDTVDLLVAIDSFGRILKVQVIENNESNAIFGVLKLIESQWISLFSGNSFRDIQRLSWQTIPAEKEYDLFVGASVTPKTVSASVYDALVFTQSNRIALFAGG